MKDNPSGNVKDYTREPVHKSFEDFAYDLIKDAAKLDEQEKEQAQADNQPK